MTVDRKCGSSEAAVHVAVGEIMAGACDVVVAGGAESMSRVPMGSNRAIHGEAFGALVSDRFEITSQGEAAERISDIWSIRSEEHTSELQSLMRISYAVFCLKKKTHTIS